MAENSKTRSVIHETVLAQRDCPSGAWEPWLYSGVRDGVRFYWAYSAWPDMYLSMGVVSNNAHMSGTWVAGPGEEVTAGPDDIIRVEKEELGELVRLSLVRVQGAVELEGAAE